VDGVVEHRLDIGWPVDAAQGDDRRRRRLSIRLRLSLA
jgi:hypothetical protein